MAYFTLSHAMDIYGQRAVYLRLNGVNPTRQPPRRSLETGMEAS